MAVPPVHLSEDQEAEGGQGAGQAVTFKGLSWRPAATSQAPYAKGTTTSQNITS